MSGSEEIARIQYCRNGPTYIYSIVGEGGSRFRLSVSVAGDGGDSWTEPGAVGCRQALFERMARMLLREDVAIWIRDDLKSLMVEIKERDAERERVREAEREAEWERRQEEDLAVAGLRTKRKRIGIVGLDVEVDAFVAGGLAHHRRLGGREGWTLTHVASGLAAGNFASKDLARKAHALLLNIHTDWSMGIDKMPTDVVRAAYQTVEELRLR